MKGRVRKQRSKPFVNPDKRTGRLSGSAEKPTSKRIKLAATIVGTSESSSPIRQRPKGASLSSKSSSNPEDGGAPSALSIRRRALVQRLQSDAGSRHEIELSEPSYARKTILARFRTFRALSPAASTANSLSWHESELSESCTMFPDSESSISCHFGRNGCNDIRKVRNRAISQLSASQNSKGLPPLSGSQHSRRTAGACAIRRLRAVCEIRSHYPRCLRAACAMLAHTAAAKHSMMAPQARNTT